MTKSLNGQALTNSRTNEKRRGPLRPAILPSAARTRGVAAQHASLSRWRSPVRIRSGPPGLLRPPPRVLVTARQRASGGDPTVMTRPVPDTTTRSRLASRALVLALVGIFVLGALGFIAAVLSAGKADESGPEPRRRHKKPEAPAATVATEPSVLPTTAPSTSASPEHATRDRRYPEAVCACRRVSPADRTWRQAVGDDARSSRSRASGRPTKGLSVRDVRRALESGRTERVRPGRRRGLHPRRARDGARGDDLSGGRPGRRPRYASSRRGVARTPSVSWPRPMSARACERSMSTAVRCSATSGSVGRRPEPA